MSVLCVHGVGQGDVDPRLVPSWTNAIKGGIHRWNPDLDLRFEFFRYDDLFDRAPRDLGMYGRALARLLASGLVHGVADLFSGAKDVFDIPEQIRWTAGMLAQWASDDHLRRQLRRRLLDAIEGGGPRLVCAHSLGSLGCYDVLRRRPKAGADRVLVTCGSQIGNPFVRDSFAGRIEPLEVRRWYHLYNPQDHVFTARIGLSASNLTEVMTEFDKPRDLLNHDPLWYFNHPNTRTSVWLDVARPARVRAFERQVSALRSVTARPRRRALLVGIDAYPNPASRLEGCRNDVFLVSAVLQECGFEPSTIRVVLDQRATTANLLERLHWLLDDGPAGGERVFFYAGHGAQIPSYGPGGEVDRLDECLVPYDFDWTCERAIADKQFAELYSQLPYDSQFVAIFDCCHSGGLAREGRRPRGLEPPDDIRHRALRWNIKRRMWQKRGSLSDVASTTPSRPAPAFGGGAIVATRLGRASCLRSLPPTIYERERRQMGHRGPYLPVIFEACQEHELSYEHRDGAASYGAFTFVLAKVLRESGKGPRAPSLLALSRLAAAGLVALGYEQTPSLVGPRSVVRRSVPWLKVLKGVAS